MNIKQPLVKMRDFSAGTETDTVYSFLQEMYSDRTLAAKHFFFF